MDENPYTENAAYYETKRMIEALDRMSDEQFERVSATDTGGYDSRESGYRVCRSCGQTGYARAYPFSTLGGDNLCDDCC